ncbi:MAG: hypothetical protein IV093_20315 [Rubrivivax sp.]|nr:hypothetical protein [Rubrivivax sp.]
MNPDQPAGTAPLDPLLTKLATIETTLLAPTSAAVSSPAPSPSAAPSTEPPALVREIMSTSSAHPNIPGLEFLGAGYDVFGYWANRRSVKANLFDFSVDGFVDQQLIDESLPQTRDNVEGAFTVLPQEIKLMYQRPTNVQYIPAFEANVEISRRKSVKDEQRSLAVSANLEFDDAVFGLEIGARYGQEFSRLQSSEYFTANVRSVYYTLTMGNYSIKPDGCLTTVAASEINDERIEPAALFDKYGTHYLARVDVGCKIVYGHEIDTSALSSSQTIESELKAHYGGLSGGGKIQSNFANNASDLFENVHVFACGMSDKQLEMLKDIQTKPYDLLVGGWHNPTLVDFDANSLVPIWTLCKKPKRATSLQTAFRAYASGKQKITSPDADLIPLYLLRSTGALQAYKLWSSCDCTAAPAWAHANHDEQRSWISVDKTPAMYVLASQKPRTVPLYAYVPATPVLNGSVYWRFETSEFDAYMESYHAFWKKLSDTPVGYVYSAIEDAPPDVQLDDVFALAQATPDFHCIVQWLYSLNSGDSRDGGGWKSAPSPLMELAIPRLQDPLEMSNPNSIYNKTLPGADLAKSFEKKSIKNVHWRVPRQ